MAVGEGDGSQDTSARHCCRGKEQLEKFIVIDYQTSLSS